MMLVLVAGSALIVEAWKYRRDNIDPETATVTRLLRKLDTPDVRQRRNAAFGLGQARGPVVRRIVPALAGLVGDPDPGVRASAVMALGRVIPGGAAGLGGEIQGELAVGVPALIEALGDSDETVRREALSSCGLIVQMKGPGAPVFGPQGPDRGRLAPALTGFVGDFDRVVHSRACSILEQLAGPTLDAPSGLLDAFEYEPDGPTLRALKAPWKNRDAVAREFFHRTAALAEKIPPRARPDLHFVERRKLREHLGFVCAFGPLPEGDAEALIEMLLSCDEELEIPIIQAIVTCGGPSAVDVLPRIAEVARRELQNPPSPRQYLAADAVVTLAPGSPEAQSLLPGLVERVAKDPPPRRSRLHYSAANILTRMGPHARPVLPQLRELAARLNAYRGREARWVLGALDLDTPFLDEPSP
jgi:hypothetical protein